MCILAWQGTSTEPRPRPQGGSRHDIRKIPSRLESNGCRTSRRRALTRRCRRRTGARLHTRRLRRPRSRPPQPNPSLTQHLRPRLSRLRRHLHRRQEAVPLSRRRRPVDSSSQVGQVRMLDSTRAQVRGWRACHCTSKATDEIRSLTSKKGMKSEDNPITHSRMGERTQHYQ